MNDSYPFRAIWINGRFVTIERIVDGIEVPLSPFETSTFSFIKDWFADKKEFAITTSGSTGTPKTIVISRDQMKASARLTALALSLQKGQSCLVCIDTKYIGGRMMLVRALEIGLEIFAVDPSATPLENLPAGQCVNFAALVPYQVEKLLESRNSHLFDNVRQIIIGGAPLNEGTIEALDKFNCQFFATYGMTETVSHIALRKLNGPSKKSYFETLPGIFIDVDIRGCAVLSVPYLSEKIITNDLVSKKSSTAFEWVGRIDNIINTGGIKVSPEKVERLIDTFLSSTGRKFRFFIHGMDDRQLGSRVVLVIEANIPDEEFLKSLHTFLKAALSPFEIPKEALLVQKFSETENGKINRLQTVKGFHANVSFKS